MLQILFSVALLISAALLFWVQLFTSKMILPVLGGSAAVWNTCMVFFQVALLLGYLYAHATERWLNTRFKAFLHPALLLLAGIMLPVSLAGIAPPAGDANPIPWLLRTLLVIVGPPFLVLAGTAPLLQAWYGRTKARSASDPYFLYAASNLGSLAALAAYPTIIEPHLHLTSQSHFWAAGYFLLMALTAACAIMVSGKTPGRIESKPAKRYSATFLSRMRWIALAFVPSSLLLGVTTHLTLDVAAAPLFWVVPLFLYLLSFVLAFQNLIPVPQKFVSGLQALLMVTLALYFIAGQKYNVLPIFALHLAAFFATAWLCHQELARSRPPVAGLTEFYLLIALGGALGGIFNTLIAPLLFNDIYEYPLMLAVACLLRPGELPSAKRIFGILGDFILPLAVFALLLLLAHLQINFRDLRDSAALIPIVIIALAVFGFQARPVRFALGIAALIVSSFVMFQSGNTIAQVRNFYGVLKVIAREEPPLHMMYSGTTIHGIQILEPDYRKIPLGYFHPEGPLGHLFKAIEGTTRAQRVGLIGLGSGSIACYGNPGQSWTYYELNPADAVIARDPKLFSFLRDCPVQPDIVLGDARLSILREPDSSFDMIILDAFSSDAIPVHLLTREAMQLYISKLKPGGILVFHISNRHLELSSVVGDVSASVGLTARYWHDAEGENDADPKTRGKLPSDWAIVARHDEDFGSIIDYGLWQPLAPSANTDVWTDDYSNLFSYLVP